MLRTFMLTAVTAFAIGAVLCACGAGGAASAVRPMDPTAAEAVGESCPIVADYGQPLIVDWKPHQRANLEEAMAGGVAVVAYDCHSLRLLSDCHLDGSYGTLGISRKEEVIELENADEIRANLPTFGGKLASDFKAEMQRGSALNLAMIMVGKRRTTVSSAERAQLRGTCDGATHFVRGAFMGAFAMGTGTRGKVSAAAHLFGAESAAESSSTKSVKNKDGDPSVCAQVEPGASSLPGGCSAILRLELAPVAVAAAGVASASPPSKRDADAFLPPSCPQGFVLSEGKCSQPIATRSHDCTFGSTECATECKKGSMRSCTILGVMYGLGEGIAKDSTQAVACYSKACDGGEMLGCSNLGVMYADGDGVARDAMQAVALFRKACDGGEMHGCSALGAMYAFGDGVAKDSTQAVACYRKACDGGAMHGCTVLGVMYADGEGVAKDSTRAVALFRKACDGGELQGCSTLAVAYKNGGYGVAKDATQAAALFRKACNAGDLNACERIRGQTP